MNTRTHEIIREYIGVLTHQALNRELTWTTAVGDMEYRYIIKSLDGKDLLGVSYRMRSIDSVDLTINGETFRTRNKPIIERVSMLFRIINYDKKDNIISDATIQFMRHYVHENRRARNVNGCSVLNGATKARAKSSTTWHNKLIRL